MNLKSPLLLAGVVLSVGTWAVAQKFVWPPTGSNTTSNKAPNTDEFREGTRPITPLGTDSRVVPTVANVPEPRPLTPTTRPAAPSASPLGWQILENPNGPNAAYIFDPVRQVFAVYHVDKASGQIMLKSVRSLAADLQLDQFNSSKPTPKDIQSMLDEAR